MDLPATEMIPSIFWLISVACWRYLLVSEHLSGKSNGFNLGRTFKGMRNPTLILVPLSFSLFYPLSSQMGWGGGAGGVHSNPQRTPQPMGLVCVRARVCVCGCVCKCLCLAACKTAK